MHLTNISPIKAMFLKVLRIENKTKPIKLYMHSNERVKIVDIHCILVVQLNDGTFYYDTINQQTIKSLKST